MLETEPKIVANYVTTGKVKLVFHHITDFANSLQASQAAECAGDQGKFWPMHAILYRQQPQVAAANNPTVVFQQFAQSLSLDMGMFTQCLSSGKYAEKVRKDDAAAKASGVRVRPTFQFSNGRRIQGAVPYDTFKSILDEALK